MVATATIRDLLLPGVVAHMNKRFGLDAKRWHYDLIVSNRGEGETIDILICRAGRMYLKPLLTAEEICNQSYKDKFGLRVEQHLESAISELALKRMVA